MKCQRRGIVEDCRTTFESGELFVVFIGREFLRRLRDN